MGWGPSTIQIFQRVFNSITEYLNVRVTNFADITSNSDGVITEVTPMATTQVAIAASDLARGFHLKNKSSKVVNVAMAATASTSAFSFDLEPDDEYDGRKLPIYKGTVSVIWPSIAGISGNLKVTRFIQ